MDYLGWILSSVLIIVFGTLTMCTLADVHFQDFTRKKVIAVIIYFVIFIIFNVTMQIIYGFELYGDFYILFTQIPLYVLLFILTKYRGIKLLFLYSSITIFSSTAMVLSSFIIYFTKAPLLGVVPSYTLMLVCVHHFLKKPVNSLLENVDNKLIGWLSILPMLYYAYNYYSTKYQYFKIVTVINHSFWERCLTLTIVLYSYVLIIRLFKTQQEKAALDLVQQITSQQLHDATQQIKQLRQAEKRAALYRHDMRHHFNYLNSCISQNKLNDATDYIQQIFDVFDDTKIIPYSSNESINLVLSSFKKEAEDSNITFTVNAPAQDFTRYAILDLCKLLYNGLENAIAACQQIDESKARYINIDLYEKNGKLCCEITNNYAIPPYFNADGIPLSIRNGHGFGVKSMIYVVNKYQGVYKFSAKDGQFHFQMSM